MKICMVTTSSLDYDSRILNEANVLSKFYDLTILARNYYRPTILGKTPFKIKRVSYWRCWPSFFNIISSLFSLTLAAFKENPDIYHAHDLDGLVCAYLPALIKKKILVYDSHELWSDLVSAKKSRVQWLMKILEKITMTRVDQGITVSDCLAQLLTKKYKKCFTSIYNYPILSKSSKKKYSLRKEHPGSVIILHIGMMSHGRGVKSLIEANQYLPTNYVTIFLGNLSNAGQLVDLIYQKKLEKNIFFKPSIKSEEILAVAKEADIGVVLTENLSLSYYYSLPNKLFQYIAAEIPILASNLPEQSRIVLKNQIGIVVNPTKPRQIAAKIMELAKPENQKKFRQNLHNLAKNKYNWNSESQKLIKFYRDLTNGNS